MRSVLGVLIILRLSSFAQENSGKILGTVSDTSGAVIPGANVTAKSPTLPSRLETATDPEGRFVLQNVPIGTYDVLIEKAGFAGVWQRDVEVNLGSIITVNPVLSVGALTETVEVKESQEALETTSSRTATVIPSSQFDAAPKGRTFNTVLLMAPGVRIEPKNGTAGVGGIQVDGASGSENAYYIDGVEVSDVRRGVLSQQNAIPFEMIQEVQVKSGGFEAEYGGATGGVINVATRSGSNAYHAEVLFQFTSAALNARDRGGWQVSPRDVSKPDFFAPTEDTYSIYYPGFRVGGPFPKLKSKLFFFGSYMPEAERSERIVDYSNDPLNRAFGVRRWTQTDTRHYGQARVDFTPTSRWQLTSSYLWSPEKLIGNLPNRDTRVAPPANDLSVQGGYRPAQAYTASANYSATSRLLLSARYGYRYFNDKIGNYGLSGEPYVFYRTPSSAAPGVPAQFAGNANFSNVSSTLRVVKEITTRHNVYLDGTLVSNLAGQQHTFKSGFSMNRVMNDAESDFTNGFFHINWGESFSRGNIVNQRGAYGYYQWEDGPRLKGEAHSRNLGLYLQDSWRIHKQLTLNLGIRFENEFLPPFLKEVRGLKVANPISFNWTDKVAPRLGAAWDVLGDGNWKLSGSFGIFFDVLKYEMARGAFGLTHHATHVYRLDNPNVFSLSRSNPGAAGALVADLEEIAIPVNSRGELEGIDPDIKPYKMREFTLSLEHALNRRVTAGVRYTRKDLLRAIEDIGSMDADNNFVIVAGNPGFGLTRSDPTHILDQKTPDGQEFLIPKAVRQYDGIEFRLQGQWSRAFLSGSYTYSRLYGNYSGAASSDESGRSDPGLSTGFDLPYYYFDSSGSQRNRLGRLGTDRPHTLKLFGSYEWKTKFGGTRFGLSQIAYSGTPDSTSVVYIGALTFPYGRGDLGRTPMLTQTDLLAHQTFRISERVSLRFEAEARNLFNQGAVIARVTQMNRSQAISSEALPVSTFFTGYNPTDFVNPQRTIRTGPMAGELGPPILPSYGLPGGSYFGRVINNLGPAASSAKGVALPNWGGYQDFRVLRLGVRFLF